MADNLKNSGISNIDISGFLSNIGHEVRIPMNMILGSAELISHENVSKKVHENINNIRQAADMLLGITEDVIDLIRINNDDFSINVDEYKAEDLIVDIRSNLEGRASSAGVETSLTIDEKLPFRLIGDHERIRMMVEKLVSNAISMTNKGKVEISIKLLPGGPGKVFIKFDITDGSDKEIPEDIVRIVAGMGSSDGSVKLEGNAVRVFLVRYIASRMSGKLTARSSKTGKNTFSLLVSQKTVGTGLCSDYDAADDLDECMDGVFSASGARILVVDANEAATKDIIRRFKRFDIDVDVVPSGAITIELVKFIKFDLILVGSGMADFDGKGVAESVRAIDGCENVPIYGYVAGEGKCAFEKTDCYDGMFYRDATTDEYKQLIRTTVSEEKINEVSSVEYTGEGLEVLEKLGLNTKEALSNFNGDEEEYKEVLIALCRSSDTKGKLLNHYIETHDYKNYIVAMHGILGVARVIGADWLATKSRELEKAAKQGIYTLIEKETGVLSDYFEKLLSSIRAVFSKEQSKEVKGAIEKDDLIALLNKLRSCLSEYQLDEVEQLFFSLATFSYPNTAVVERLHTAEALMMAYNYEGVIECIDEVLEILATE